jgi:hypothetical protein
VEGPAVSSPFVILEATASSSPKDPSEPREASRFLRRNKSRVWLASLSLCLCPETQKAQPGGYAFLFSTL